MDIDKINRMSFRELKIELLECNNNPVKEQIIRRLMLRKYELYKKKKIDKHRRIQIKWEKQRMHHDMERNINEIELQERISKSELPKRRNYGELTGFGPLDEFEGRQYDAKFGREIEKDHLNNNLMLRMNSNVDIKKTKPLKGEFIPPYSNEVGATYQSVFNERMPKDDFSNGRFMKR